MRRAVRIEVLGLVQGIGYRPFVAGLAGEEQVSGRVWNAGGIVHILAAGEEDRLASFQRRLKEECPPGGRVDQLTTIETEEEVPPSVFSITESAAGEEEVRFLPPDLATCPACERELFDARDRRFRHPFISCTACGPRYSILTEIPYDRERTTMAPFPLCPDCERDYREPGGRRRHAQTICCPSCGPVLTAVTAEEELTGEAAFVAAVNCLLNGGICAVKGIGGFHFAFLPEEKKAAARLREFKARERKPFAVMFPDLASLEEWCNVTPTEEKLLTGPVRPILLLEKKKDLPREVGMGSDRIGAFLPCNPLQSLLLRETGPLVMTSGNRGNRPIALTTEEVRTYLDSGCPDLILTHDREILTPLDDSIYQVVRCAGAEFVQVLRRSRGLVPEPVLLPRELPEPVRADGGDLKNVFAFGKGRAVYLSQHLGDLAEPSVGRVREKELTRMGRLFGIPRGAKRVADLHPGYFSSLGAEVRVQHHHAHILSVMAEHGLTGPVLGLAFDGTGLGTDHAVWGSEFLVCRGKEFEKRGSLRPVRLPGGDEGAKNARQSLQGYLFAAGQNLTGEERALAVALSSGEVGILSSSMGRLFDAASAALSVCGYNSYEGECAIALEILAHQARQAYPLTLPLTEEGGIWYGEGPRLILELQRAAARGIPRPFLALGFHQAVADFAVAAARGIAAEEKIHDIALSGGTFVNRILLRNIASRLRAAGFSVYVNEKVPCGDGGLALGQAYYMAL